MNKPRRNSKRLEGAPPYVLAVYDTGPKTNDRYTVMFTWPMWDPENPRVFPYLGFNECPTSPNMGISMWGEMHGRYGAGKPISWNDLPEHLQRHVTARANFPDPIVMAHLKKDPHHGWLLIDHTGQGGHGPDFRKKTEAVRYAEEHNIIVMPEASP